MAAGTVRYDDTEPFQNKACFARFGYDIASIKLCLNKVMAGEMNSQEKSECVDRQHPDQVNHLAAFVSKIKQDRQPPIVADTFAHYYRKVVSGQTGWIHEQEISPVEPDELVSAESLTEYTSAGMRAYPKAVRIVLNGGLGTQIW